LKRKRRFLQSSSCRRKFEIVLYKKNKKKIRKPSKRAKNICKVYISCKFLSELSEGKIPVAVVLSSVPNKQIKQTNKHHKEQKFRPAAEDPRSPRPVAMCVSLRLRSTDSGFQTRIHGCRCGCGFDSGSRRTRVIVAIYINYIYTYENERKKQKPQKKKQIMHNFNYFF